MGNDVDLRRTTPRYLRAPGLLALGVLAGYFAACFHYALGPSLPAWSMWGNWQMFSVGGRSNSALEAEGLVGGEWVSVDLDALFPSRWESGPRYRMIQRHAEKLKVVADSACLRDVRRPGVVRFYEVRWPILVGQDPHSRVNAKRKMLLEWRCDATASRPKGIRI